MFQASSGCTQARKYKSDHRKGANARTGVPLLLCVALVGRSLCGLSHDLLCSAALHYMPLIPQAHATHEKSFATVLVREAPAYTFQAMGGT